jgi:hypothetical protein
MDLIKARVQAVRFEPLSGAHRVPLETFVRALDAILEGIVSVRASLLPVLVQSLGWPATQIRQALDYSVEPLAIGSLVVPIVPGVSEKGTPLATQQIHSGFWELAAPEISLKRGRARSRLTASGADAFARASSIASKGHSRLSLVGQGPGPGDWFPVVELTPLEQKLRDFAERQHEASRSQVALVGRIVAISFDPPGFTLEAGGIRQRVKMTGELRGAARENWGSEVVVIADAGVGLEGQITEPHAVEIRAAAPSDTDFESTFGSLKDIWGTKEAEQYLESLRPRSH